MLRGVSVLPDVQKIAVLRANALGDLIFALPALHALRITYPDAELVLLGRPWHPELLQDRREVVDRVVVVPPYAGLSEAARYTNDPKVLDTFFSLMRDERFDLAVQIHGGGATSNPFVRSLGARTTVGMRTPDAPPLDRWLPYVYYQSEIVRYLEVVALVGATTHDLEPHLPLLPDDIAASLVVVPETAVPLAVLHPGASDGRRRWPVDTFAAVGDALATDGMRVVVTGTPWEAETVTAVIAAMHAPAVNLCGTLSLRGLTGILSRAAMVVSNDTGPLHLAGAVGTPTVGIYWCLNVLNSGPLTRARHRPCLSFRLECPRCGANCMTTGCAHRDSFVADVTVEEVIEAARELLQSPITTSAWSHRHAYALGPT